MNDLIMEFLSELQSAQEAHNKALEDAFDAHQKADIDAFNDHSERVKLAREKLAAAMNARFLAWNGEIGVDADKLPPASTLDPFLAAFERDPTGGSA